MPEADLPAIPWRFHRSPLGQAWRWDTPHFVAGVSAEGPAYGWHLGDLVLPQDGAPRHLAEGRARDFSEAERAVRAAIGKSYPPQLGYARYAGGLATTFTIATGQEVDFGECNGQRVVIDVAAPGGAPRTFVGYARVVHYEIAIETDSGTSVRVQPAHILAVAHEGGGGHGRGGGDFLGVGRLYRGSVQRDCTGRPGYMPGTVDHSAAACAVHEQGGMGATAQ